MAIAAVSVSACSIGDEVIPGTGQPISENAGPGAALQSVGQPPAVDRGGVPGAMDVTPRQRAYLDALAVAGVTPSSELLALSIGSYVCQAHAAHQSDQAVWDYVLPMVRGDVRDSRPAAPPAGQVNSVTADYIRIATERLC